MVTCSNCGTELSVEAKFCRKCGKKVESAKNVQDADMNWMSAQCFA